MGRCLGPDKGINKETIVACVPHLMAFPLTFVEFLPRLAFLCSKDQYIIKIHLLCPKS